MSLDELVFLGGICLPLVLPKLLLSHFYTARSTKALFVLFSDCNDVLMLGDERANVNKRKAFNAESWSGLLVKLEAHAFHLP